jgi:hypothetical protein
MSVGSHGDASANGFDLFGGLREASRSYREEMAHGAGRTD